MAYLHIVILFLDFSIEVSRWQNWERMLLSLVPLFLVENPAQSSGFLFSSKGLHFMKVVRIREILKILAHSRHVINSWYLFLSSYLTMREKIYFNLCLNTFENFFFFAFHLSISPYLCRILCNQKIIPFILICCSLRK